MDSKLQMTKQIKIESDSSAEIFKLQAAVKARDVALVQALLSKKRVDVDASHYPVLSLASEDGSVDIVKALIKQGANVNKVDSFGYKYTALHRACKKGHIDVVKVLITEGANLDAADNNGKTPLHHVIKAGYSEIAELLIKKGADVNAADKDRILPLLEADFYDHTKIANLLREAEAETLAPEDSGIELLSWFYNKGKIKVVTLLIAAILLKNIEEKKPDSIEQNQELSGYWDEYKTKIDSEISALKKITFNTVSLCDFLTVDNLSKLATMSCNKKMQKIITANNFTSKYLIFGLKIKKKFEKGFEKNKYLNTALNSIYHRNNNKLLPLECWEEILKNLDTQSLKNVTNVAFLFFKSTATSSAISEITDTRDYLSKA